LQEAEILYGDYIPKQRSKMTINGIEGIMIAGEQKYTIQIPEVHTDFYGGAIFFAKKDNHLFMFHFICENLYFSAYYPQFVEILEGFHFPDEKSE